MTTPLWPDWLDDTVWAKSPAKGEGSGPESLAHHTWQVLQRLAEAIRLRPRLPRQLGCPWLWKALFWACLVHDFGKAAQGFQQWLRGGPRWRHRHEVLSLAFVDWLDGVLSEEEQRWVAAAIVSHHRDADEIQRLYPEPDDPTEDPLVARVAEIDDGVGVGLWRWLGECTESWVEVLGLGDAGIRAPAQSREFERMLRTPEVVAGRVRHWLREYRRWLRDLDRRSEPSVLVATLALRGHLVACDHMAPAHTGPLPTPILDESESLLSRLAMDATILYDHQQACGRTRGSALLVAPTGSGKTEAALLWAAAQSDGLRSLPRLFYTLPYQASMNAMYDRLNEKAFPGQVGLEHSRAALALYRRLTEEAGPLEATYAAQVASNLARLNYFPVRVLSPYQILKGPYRLKGYEGLLTDCFQAGFILDEIHAYEPERLAMILATVRYLREQFGALFFVMSATLPAIVTTRLTDALGSCSTVRATADLFARFARHRLGIVEGDLLSETRLRDIGTVALRGNSVLLCCNTVKRAQQAYDGLRAVTKPGDVLLLHGRFNARDRLDKELVVRDSTGVTSMDRKPIVLVATQVVEVSLDIDLDVMYSDPAPLEALIQRFGRVNRRRLREWAPVYVFTEPRDGQGIYDAQLVEAGLRVLAQSAGRIIEEERISDWLDSVYQGAVGERWNQRYDEAYTDFDRACLSRLRAFNSDEALEELFYRAFDSIEVLPATLWQAYTDLMERREPLEASQLLVPLRWGQFCRLRAEGRVRELDDPRWPRVVDAAYDSERGMVL